MVKKRSYLLLEIVIALGLAASLVLVLFQFLISNARFERGLETTQAVIREQQRVREKIESIFLSLAPGEQGSPFYTLRFPNESELSLIALFNAGIDPDPAYSGPNTARLFVNKNKELCLAQWPLERPGHRTEILLDDVRAIEWEFLGQRYDKDPTAAVIKGTIAWLKKWPQSTPGVPSIIRLKVWHGIDKKRQREPNLRIAFILPIQEPIRIKERRIKEL